MKRVFKTLFVFVLAFLLATVLLTISNVTSADTVVDEKGNTITYPYSNKKAITLPEYEKQVTEFRGTWVSFFAGDISSYSSDDQMKEQLTNVLKTMEEYNMNAIMFHIRTHNDAMYDTELAPQSSYVEGVDYERFDYLEWFINECHKRGIEFHAWLNPYRISNGTTIANILSKYQDYPINPAHYEENILMNNRGEAILDPGRPAVQEYIVNVCMEIIEKYDVDAIHFDDYFYLDGVDDTATRNLYNKGKLTTDNFRRKSVDDFIYSLSSEMDKYNKDNNRCVQLGISPSGIYRNSGASYVEPSAYRYDSNGTLIYPIGSATNGYSHYGDPLYCDTKKWIDKGWIDYIIPQSYNSFSIELACYASEVEWWNGCIKNKKTNLYIGTGLYKKSSTETGTWHTVEDEWYNQLRFNQKNVNVKGTCVYQYRSLTSFKASKGNQKVLNNCFTNTTKLPELQRYTGIYDTNVQVNNLKLYKGTNSIALSFDKIDYAKNYLIYQYRYSLDLEEPEQIVGMVGNDKNSNEVIFNLKYDSKNGENFAVIPVTKANELCKEKLITIGEASQFNESTNDVISFNDYIVTGTFNGGSKMTIRFSDATIKYGTEAKYEAYVVYGTTWDEAKKIKLNVSKVSTMNYANFTVPEFKTPVLVKLYAYTEFGKCESEEILVAMKYQEYNEVMKDIFKYIDYFMESLYGDDNEK